MPFHTIYFMSFIYYKALQITFFIQNHERKCRFLQNNFYFWQFLELCTKEFMSFESRPIDCINYVVKVILIIIILIIFNFYIALITHVSKRFTNIMKTKCQNKDLCFYLMDCDVLFSVFHIYFSSGRYIEEMAWNLFEIPIIYSLLGDI